MRKIEGDSEFVGPCGIAMSEDNRIFVAYKNGRLRVLDCSSSYEASCKVKCTGVAVHNGQVYCINDTVITVLNTDNLTPSRSFYAIAYAADGSNMPFPVHSCNIATDSKGVLYVIRDMVVKFKHDKHLDTITISQFKDLVGICIDSNDIMYVTKEEGHKVMALTTEGKYLGSFGCSGRCLNARGVAVDKTGNVYVCDYVTGEILVSRP